MKKELLKLKFKRLVWALLFGTFLFVIAALPTLVTVWLLPLGQGIWTSIEAIIMFWLWHKAFRRPTDWIDKVFITPKIEFIDTDIKAFQERLTATKLKKLEEREQVMQSKVDILDEVRLLPYTVSSNEQLRLITVRLNDIHSNEVNNKNIVDIRDVDISKKDFKAFKKDVLKNVKKVKISRINAEKLKDIEEILTGKKAKEEAMIKEEHARQLELANAGAAKTIIGGLPQDTTEKTIGWQPDETGVN